MPCAPASIRDVSTRCQEWPGKKICNRCALLPAAAAVFRAPGSLAIVERYRPTHVQASKQQMKVAREFCQPQRWRRANVWSDHIVAHGSGLRNTGRIDCLRHHNGCGIRPTRATIVMADEYLIVSIVLAQNTEAIGVRNPGVQTRCSVGAERD